MQEAASYDCSKGQANTGVEKSGLVDFDALMVGLPDELASPDAKKKGRSRRGPTPESPTEGDAMTALNLSPPTNGSHRLVRRPPNTPDLPPAPLSGDMSEPGKLARRARSLELLGERALALLIRADLVWAGKCTWCGYPLRSAESLRQGIGGGCRKAHRR
jgi:hypothetical protein